jgi:hypothetical protein
MKNYARKAAVAVFAGAALTTGALAPASAAPVITGGVVNVTVADSLNNVLSSNDVGVGVAANIAAAVCGTTVPVAVLATQVVAQGGTFSCPVAANPNQVLTVSR